MLTDNVTEKCMLSNIHVVRVEFFKYEGFFLPFKETTISVIINNITSFTRMTIKSFLYYTNITKSNSNLLTDNYEIKNRLIIKGPVYGR